MAESQNIEWKQSWHEDYLKWVCGFANAKGGEIFIGKDDDGKVVHLSDYRTLLESIPQKIRNLIGITCDVNLEEENGNKYIHIIVRPYSVPVSLRGRYYYRSGSTKVELTGVELNEFLLKKAGKTWDDVVEEQASIEDINSDTISLFKQISLESNSDRMPNPEGLSDIEFLDKLQLVENGKLKRAAIVLFGKDPSRFYSNVAVKIGKFGLSDADLIFQDEVKGNLIQIILSLPEVLNSKFLTKHVSFEGLQRIEKGEYPAAALREMFLNALVHRNYMGAIIQLRVYENKITIWNDGGLSEGMSIESLSRQHASKPRNPKIANACFMAGFIDTWGRGTLKIIEACDEARLPKPNIEEVDGGMQFSLHKFYSSKALKDIGLSNRQLLAYDFVRTNGEISNKQYQEEFKVSKPTATRDLTELCDVFGVLRKEGITGVGTVYKL